MQDKVNTGSRRRIVCFDLISIFSCICVSIVHFNAGVCGYNGTFIYPQNSLIPNHYLDGRVYLGSLGVSMFFMLSGARLMYTYRGVKSFMVRRIQSIFPMFWIAYIAATIFDLLYYKGVGASNPLVLVFSFLGMDGYLMSLGLLATDFYKVGEWFLGCILLLYMLFPLLHVGVEKKPVMTSALALAVYALCVRRFNEITFFLRIPEMLFGMLFVKYDGEKHAVGLTAASAALLLTAWLARNLVEPLTVCIALALFLFSLFTLASRLIRHEGVKNMLAYGSKLTYPIFLVHHWLIIKMVDGFYIENMRRRTVLMLFFAFVVLTLILSHILMVYGDKVSKKLFRRRSA